MLQNCFTLLLSIQNRTFERDSTYFNLNDLKKKAEVRRIMLVLVHSASSMEIEQPEEAAEEEEQGDS